MSVLRRNYVFGVWLLAIPAALLCGIGGLLAFPTVPFMMAAPLVAALVLTLSVMEKRPHYNLTVIMGLFVAQITVASFTVGLAVSHRAWMKDLSFGAWCVGVILPFVMIAVVLRSAHRDRKDSSG